MLRVRAMRKDQFHKEIKLKVFPICSQFQTDIRKRFSGCKWFFMTHFLENGLEQLHHVQKMAALYN